MERPNTWRQWELDLELLRLWLYSEPEQAEEVWLDDEEAWVLLRYFEYIGIMMEPDRWDDSVIRFHRKWVEYTNPCAEIELGWSEECNLGTNLFPLPNEE